MQNKKKFYKNWLSILGLLYGLALTPVASAKITVKDLRPGLKLPIVDKKSHLFIPKAILKRRLIAGGKEPFVEPLYLYLKMKEPERSGELNYLAKPGQVEALSALLKKKQNISRRPGIFKVQLDSQIYSLIDEEKYLYFNRIKHHRLWLDPTALDQLTAKELVYQIRPFFTDDSVQALAQKLPSTEQIDIEAYLLPSFAKKRLRRFTAYQGPNCFQAALAFQSHALSRSSRVNVKREVNYHPSMINYDELWRVIQSHFDEIDPRAHALKYGDVILYIEPQHGQDPESTPYVDFRWIQHAAVYLFNDFVFSKASKSADSPYSIKLLAEEWRSWQAACPGVGLKVFRFRGDQKLKNPLRRPQDWLY